MHTSHSTIFRLTYITIATYILLPVIGWCLAIALSFGLPLLGCPENPGPGITYSCGEWATSIVNGLALSVFYTAYTLPTGAIALLIVLIAHGLFVRRRRHQGRHNNK